MSSFPDRSADSTAIGGAVDALVTTPDARADVELMAAVAANDRSAQRVLVQRLARRVRKITGLLCRTSADADDAAQLALIEILKSAESFRTATNLEGWAERLTVRTTLRTARRERSREGLLERWMPEGLLPWSGAATQRPVEAVGLDALLRRLSRDRFQAFVLHHALDYTVEEIAAVTGAPVGTVKDRLVSARKQLRKMLSAETRAAGGRIR